MEGLSGDSDEMISVMGVDVQSQLVQMDYGLLYHMKVRKEEWGKIGIETKDFSRFLAFLLYDVRYIRAFNMPVADKVISRIDEKAEIISFSFEIIID